jgi:hypothetical protein
VAKEDWKPRLGGEEGKAEEGERAGEGVKRPLDRPPIAPMVAALAREPAACGEGVEG